MPQVISLTATLRQRVGGCGVGGLGGQGDIGGAGELFKIRVKM